MLNADPLLPRPTLTNPSLLATALDRLSSGTDSVTEVWRVLTENYTVDLDAVAMLLPRQEPEPLWLAARD
ncbi:hypothetical protein [Methylobacterium iners]|uniref:Uncharacterized protein n=1 Tax=Methylobacterium iners TaxID=418707 RepID=A0ABQ4RZK8_9HYPH|nr:hypothetical protein [Methylobacterium iners]GJD96031.1 hypothetical protein OCOJLMKI_3249 [Methylobacterium iners]